jgi:Tfp pilus assembly protein PilZ
MKPQILLAVIDNARQSIYVDFLRREQANCLIVPSLRELVIQAAKQPYCGILIDMPVMVKASRMDKNLVEDALTALPSARINIARGGTDILVLPINGDSTKTTQTASDFVRYCCSTLPKLVFIRNRIPLHLNVLLAITSDMFDAMQTASIDFSEGGCFLFTVDSTLVPGNTVWIRLIALEDQTPIKGTICWKRDWGTTNKVPGVGIRFDVLTVGQESEILALIAKHKGSIDTHVTAT